MSKEFLRLRQFVCDTIHEFEIENSKNKINDIESVGSHFEIDENFEKPCIVYHHTFRKGESSNYFYIEKEEMKKAKVLFDFLTHYIFEHIENFKLPRISDKSEFLKWWLGYTFVSVTVDIKEKEKERVVTFDQIDHEESFVWTGDPKELDSILDHICALYLIR